MVTPQYQGDKAGVAASYDQGFQAARRTDVKETADIVNSMLIRSRRFLQGLARRRSFFRGQGRRNEFHIGCEFGALRKRDTVLTGVSQYVKFMGYLAADITAVGNNGAELQLKAIENACIGPVHHLIRLFQGILAEMKGISVFHNKFPGSHDSETRANLIAEFGLDLVEIGRQLFITADYVPDQVCYDFLVGGSQTEIPFMPILETQ